MKRELIEQWQFYTQAIEEDETIGFTLQKNYLNFRDFMFWLETGKINKTRYR